MVEHHGRGVLRTGNGVACVQHNSAGGISDDVAESIMTGVRGPTEVNSPTRSIDG